MTYRSLIVLAVAAALARPASGVARTLEVGPGKEFAMPSAAASAAAAGDHIVVAPGSYFDCAVLSADNLVIEGSDAAGGAVMTDKTCQGKGILITTGAHVVVRNLTLTRARVADSNGAGIRDESQMLTVERVRFINNQDGILTGAPDGATLIVRDSDFERNGTCDQACAHGIYAGHIALLHVENSRFNETKEGHSIKSRAARTEVIGCTISDGPNGTSSYLIDVPNGGSLVASGNTMQKGPKSGNHTAAIIVGEEGVTQQTDEITVKNNSFRNDGDFQTSFVDNLTATEAKLSDNSLTGAVKPLRGDGESN